MDNLWISPASLTVTKSARPRSMWGSYNDKYETTECKLVMPAEAGTLLVTAEKKDMVDNKRRTYFRIGVGKLLRMTRWSCPEVQNSVRELLRQGSTPVNAH
eukprot:3136855-Ditylum_brightwellii.AAC.1